MSRKLLEHFSYGEKNTHPNFNLTEVPHHITGPLLQTVLLENNFWQKFKKIILLFSHPQECFQIAENLSFYVNHLDGQINVLSYDEIGPYSEAWGEEKFCNQLLESLCLIQTDEKQIICLDTLRLAQLFPAPKTLMSKTIALKIGGIKSPQELTKQLLELGFTNDDTQTQANSFSSRGEVVDIIKFNQTIYRVGFFDEEIERIHLLNPKNFEVLESKTTLLICPHLNSFYHNEDLKLLRQNYPMPPMQYKAAQKKRGDIIELLKNKAPITNASFFLPLLSEKPAMFSEYFNSREHLIISFNGEKALSRLKGNARELHYLHGKAETFSLYPTLPPDKFFASEKEVEVFLKNAHGDFSETPLKNKKGLGVLSLELFLFQHKSRFPELKKESLFEFVLDNTEFHYYILFESENVQKQLLKNKALSEENLLFCASLKESFFLTETQTFYFTSRDLKIRPQYQVKRNLKSEFFSSQLMGLHEGDYVIHQVYGTGIYQGIKTMTTAGQEADYVIIKYAEGDTVYLPVYKLDLIQKYADAQAGASVDNLNSQRFKKAKENAKKAVKKLAFNLIELYAKRALRPPMLYHKNHADFLTFEQSFPYHLTEDQFQAIQDVLEDMQGEKIMDRLICGDVGFGKTEVAMRAAFLAVQNDKQVAVLVPTTILCYQHFLTFCERFKNFPLSIDYLCRLKSERENKETLEKMAQGKVDIVIGTHKLLSDKIKFKNLGLIIIDEEHRFGVAHKEKLKLMRESLDCLTLSATPIPRTLQLSFMGLKDFSLITTPPHRRKPINTYVVEDNDENIKNALEKELARGGQAFVVYNRVRDIERVAAHIQQLTPKARIVIGHGQMNEKTLEKKIKDFYDGAYDILVATTIIESGIDIPRANTMIIYDAQKFGLAQLHQLRGRIGRSDIEAFAYLVVTRKVLNAQAQMRISALQSMNKLGLGFSMASADLDIRGAGDIIGAEQSGHMSAIGLELYMELLQEEIAKIKGEEYTANRIEISIQNAPKIPDNYIKNNQVKLMFYKKIAQAQASEELHTYHRDLEQRFGKPPQEVERLLEMMKVKICLQEMGVIKASLSSSKITFYLDKRRMEKNPERTQRLIEFVLKSPDFQLSPQDAIVLTTQEQNFLKRIQDLSQCYLTAGN